MSMEKKKIKTKEKKSSIRKLDKVKAWTERIKNPIVYSNKKLNDTANKDKSVNEYGEDKIKYTTNRLKDETIYANKKAIHKAKNEIVKHHVKKKAERQENISKNPSSSKEKIKIKENSHNGRKGIKEVNYKIKKRKNISNKETKISKQILEQGKKLAINSSKKVSQGAKKIGNFAVSSIKGIIASLKSLVAVLSGGGIFVLVIIMIFAIAMAIVNSVFGIFLSSENLENSIKMSDCITELNDEMDRKINQIKIDNIHEEVIISSQKTSWKDVLSIYAVKVSNGNDGENVILMDKEKKKILKEVFWEMNSITSNIVIEEFESESLGSLEEIDFTSREHQALPSYNGNLNQKRVLHINIIGKTPDEMKTIYNFNEEQLKQYDELTSEEYDNLWYGVIYGSYRDSGEIIDWKQGRKEWANIRIGTTSKTIGNIGCLTTSIAILIKKSDVPTKTIYPFNPGTFVIALNNNYGFDSHGNLLYSAINRVVPNFKYVGTIDLKGKSKSEKLYEIKKYSDNGYFLAVEVKGATPNNQHWVAVDSVNNNGVLMLDPSVGNERDMWSKYDWTKTSGFIYFKAIN